MFSTNTRQNIKDRFSKDLAKSRPTFKKKLLIASFVFAVFLMIDLGIVGFITFNYLSKSKVYDALRLSRECASDIADRVIKLSLQPDGLNFNRLVRNREILKRYVRRHIEISGLLFNVEVRDKFSNRIVVFIQSKRIASLRPNGKDVIELQERSDGTISLKHAPIDYPIVVKPVMIAGGREGEIRVGLSQDKLEEEFGKIRRELIYKLSLGIGASIILLIIAFGYVIRLLNKTRKLEAEAQMADRLAYVGTLASGLAHEIRNPLNSMNMNVQMLEEECQGRMREEGEELKELLYAIKGEINRLERLVNNFLTYARPQKLTMAESDLNAMVSDVARFLKAEIEQKKIALELNLDPYVPRVEMDEQQIKQALMNILINSKQVLKEGGKISIATKMGSEGKTIIEIKDNGPGIPQEMKDKIFDIFFSTRGGGTGLGLPIAQKIVEMHGGWIDLWTEAGKGSHFTIYLPRTHKKERR
jgi:signal transduction histidine kinase